MSGKSGVKRMDSVWFRFEVFEAGPRTRSLFLSDALYGNGCCHSDGNTVLRAALLLSGADASGRTTGHMLGSIVKKFTLAGEYLSLSATKRISADHDYNCSCGRRGLANGLDRLQVDVCVSIKLSGKVSLGDVEDRLNLLFMKLDKMEPLVTSSGSTFEAFMETECEDEARD